MNLDAIAIGYQPPDDLNTIIEVPIGVLRMEDDGGGDEGRGDAGQVRRPIPDMIERAGRA